MAPESLIQNIKAWEECHFPIWLFSNTLWWQMQINQNLKTITKKTFTSSSVFCLHSSQDIKIFCHLSKLVIEQKWNGVERDHFSFTDSWISAMHLLAFFIPYCHILSSLVYSEIINSPLRTKCHFSKTLLEKILTSNTSLRIWQVKLSTTK